MERSTVRHVSSERQPTIFNHPQTILNQQLNMCVVKRIVLQKKALRKGVRFPNHIVPELKLKIYKKFSEPCLQTLFVKHKEKHKNVSFGSISTLNSNWENLAVLGGRMRGIKINTGQQSICKIMYGKHQSVHTYTHTTTHSCWLWCHWRQPVTTSSNVGFSVLVNLQFSDQRLTTLPFYHSHPMAQR